MKLIHTYLQLSVDHEEAKYPGVPGVWKAERSGMWATGNSGVLIDAGFGCFWGLGVCWCFKK